MVRDLLPPLQLLALYGSGESLAPVSKGRCRRGRELGSEQEVSKLL